MKIGYEKRKTPVMIDVCTSKRTKIIKTGEIHR